MVHRCGVISLLIFCVTAGITVAEDDGDSADVLAGHSYHGEAFNEGPRQKPYKMEGLGQCQFSISTENEQAQTFFNQGVDQLHGFWYFEAERSFRQVAILDPDCAMAYWGLAMANLNNEDRAQKFIEQADEKTKLADRAITSREKLYIEALLQKYDQSEPDEKKRASNVTKKLEELVLKYPEDIEAKAFLACQIWMNSRKLKIASYVGVKSILDDIFAVNPNHPAHHYQIHLWDYEDPSVALESAAKCGPSLPAIAHMWHMPGHIYSRLKRYEDAVWQQEASARIDHRHMIHDWVLPDQIHNFAHNNEWCIRNLIHVGRIHDAIDLAMNMISLPRHPKYNTLNEKGSGRYGRRRLMQVLSTYQMWDRLIAECESGVLHPTEDETENMKRLRFLGRAYFHSGQFKKVDDIHGQLSVAQATAENLKIEAEKTAREKQKLETEDLQAAAAAWQRQLPVAWQRVYNNLIKKIVRRDHRSRVRKAINEATDDLKAQIAAAKNAIDEMEAYQLIQQSDFRGGWEKLKRIDDVDPFYTSSVGHLCGETETAILEATEFVEKHENEVSPQAKLCMLLWGCGKRTEALAAFEKLREMSSAIETEAPFFKQLAPIASAAGAEKDWLITKTPASDLGVRPELDSLGPFRWRPNSAPTWSLFDANNLQVRSDDYGGKPVVIIFYLGHGCLHCAEQLQAFAPKAAAFAEAGIPLVAISTDDRIGLKKSIDAYGATEMPIHLLSNEELDVFKQFRCFDEFENQPLHGTFLLDESGRIRWQDISFEPFMEPDFLLKEAKRLLQQPIYD